MKLLNSYWCKHCQKLVARDSTKAWVKSYCETVGKTVHLIRRAK